MAEFISHRWDPDYSEEGIDFVYNNEGLRDVLADNVSSLSKELEFTDTFWDLLLQREVVDEVVQHQIMAKWTKRFQAMSLVNHVLEVEVYKFHGFIWALVNSHQSHLAEQLGFDPCDYLDMEVFMMSSSFRCPACQGFFSKAFILTGCGHYVCGPCVKGAQFTCRDDKKEDIMCPVSECNKLTEASPSAGNIGLNEDKVFNNLSAAVKQVSEVKKPKAQNVEKKNEETPIKAFQEQVAELEKKISTLQKYKDLLAEHKAGVQDHIQEEVKKVDEWAEGNLVQYSNICQQVEKHLQKSCQWQKAASELSLLMRARPGSLEECLKGKVNLPKENLMEAAENLVTKLDAGMALPLLYTPSTSVPPAQAKFFTHWKLPEDQICHKLAWLSDDLLILTDEGVWRMDLNDATFECEPTLIEDGTWFDMSSADDGTWILADGNSTEIHYPDQNTVEEWTPEGEDQPWRVFINNNNIFVGNEDSNTIRSYSRELMYVDQYDIGMGDYNYHIHVSEKGRLIKSSEYEDRMYIMNLETKETSTLDSPDDEERSYFGDICTVNHGDYILVCWNGDNPVSVYTHDGQFVHSLDVEGDVECLTTIAVLVRKGTPTLMAIAGYINGKTSVGVYTLE